MSRNTPSPSPPSVERCVTSKERLRSKLTVTWNLFVLYLVNNGDVIYASVLRYIISGNQSKCVYYSACLLRDSRSRNRQQPIFLTMTVWDKYLNHNPPQQSLFLHCEYCNPSHWLRYEVRDEVLLSNALRQKNDLKRNRVGELQKIQVTVFFVLSTELLMWICHRKEILKPIFLASALRQSESRNCGLRVGCRQKDGATLMVGTWQREKHNNKLVEWEAFVANMTIKGADLKDKFLFYNFAAFRAV